MNLLRFTQDALDGDRYRVEIALEGDGPRRIAKAELKLRLTRRDEADLRWYLEDYLQWPHEPAPEIAARVERLMEELGPSYWSRSSTMRRPKSCGTRRASSCPRHGSRSSAPPRRRHRSRGSCCPSPRRRWRSWPTPSSAPSPRTRGRPGRRRRRPGRCASCWRSAGRGGVRTCRLARWRRGSSRGWTRFAPGL